MEIAEKFNVQVEADLIFYKKYILHVIDRATRWYAAKVVGTDMQGKRPESLVAAFAKSGPLSTDPPVNSSVTKQEVCAVQISQTPTGRGTASTFMPVLSTNMLGSLSAEVSL